MMSDARPKLGVSIVSYGSSDVILPCLESLLASDAAERLSIVVVDNASPDDTIGLIERWARGEAPMPPENGPVALVPVPKPVRIAILAPGEPLDPDAAINIVRGQVNGGFAYGVNRGLELLADRPEVFAFWVLNPDCVVPSPALDRLLAAADAGGFGLLSGRILYFEDPEMVQTDGGRVDPRTGRCVSFNVGADARTARMPEASSLDYVSGANMIASRAFLETAGLMPEEYFLFFEEVDWAFRRKGLPIVLVPDAAIYHRGGTSTGSATIARGPAPLAAYLMQRNRIWFVQRWFPRNVMTARLFTVVKASQFLARGWRDSARAALAGGLGLKPPADVCARFTDPEVARRALGAAPVDAGARKP